MTRYFSVFPDGSAGIGLLALRVSLLPALIAPLVRGEFGVRLGLAVAAILLLLGLFTRSASTALSVVVLGATLWALWDGAPAMFGTLEVHWMVGAVSASLALVGPGAYSIDSRRFGWRELTVSDE